MAREAVFTGTGRNFAIELPRQIYATTPLTHACRKSFDVWSFLAIRRKKNSLPLSKNGPTVIVMQLCSKAAMLVIFRNIMFVVRVRLDIR